ncbi:MAG: thioesterase family protein [Candidatus Aureabacteria bacterium]|nr:thioesterase family protein [Candidatus Auribacterota bacterium]
MKRIALDLPKIFDFSTELGVRVSDVNYGGHLGNDALLSLLHEARIQLLKSHGFSESDIEGYGIIMINSAVAYVSEAFHGDLLTIEVAVGNVDRVGCDFFYRITRKADGKEIARAKTGVVFFDYARSKLARTPERFKTTFVHT